MQYSEVEVPGQCFVHCSVLCAHHCSTVHFSVQLIADQCSGIRTVECSIVEYSFHPRMKKEQKKKEPRLEEEGTVQVQCLEVMSIRLFQKGALCGNDVGSKVFSDHTNIRNNFYKILFPQKCSGVCHLDPPSYPTPPLQHPK